MQVYLINLDSEKERLASATKQLDAYGISFERFPAVCAKALPENSLRLAVNGFRWWCAVGRPVRKGEIGCAMSHYAIYRKMVEPVCILEDDVMLAACFRDVLLEVEKWLDPSRPQVILLSNHTKERHDSTGIFPSKADMYTEGYVLTKSAANALLKSNWPMQRPCDHWGSWAKRGVIELYHAFPTVCTQNQSQFESGTVDANCFKVSDLDWFCWLLHKSKRLIGKIIDEILPI